jgi:DNA-binding winged helix-turn-helix (wHTH) protein/tetratricopeptide (TPR) repeat protein
MRPSISQSSVPQSPVVCFSVFEADLAARELRKNGVKVKVQELPFRALELLLNRPGEVLTREEFRQALWPEGVFVDFDHGLSSAINRLRDALGDSADTPIFIATVERRGYRWLAPVHRPALLSPIPPIASEINPAGIETAETSALPNAVEVSDKTLAHPASHFSWKWVLLAVASILVFALWIFRSDRRSAGSGMTSQPSTSSAVNPGSPHVPNPEARDLYLKGRYYWNKRTPEDLNKAVDFFTQAIVHDPGYADAFVGLADSYNLLREFSVMPPSEAFPRALAAAKKAVELDDKSSDAHASVAFVSFFGMWDVKTAEVEFRRALELNPNNAVAHQWYATYLVSLHRLPESLAEIERARALDPSSRSILADKGCILFLAGKDDEAIALLKQMEATEPDFVSPHRYLRYSYLDKRDYPNYLLEFKKEADLLHDGTSLALVQAAEMGFAKGGGKAMLESLRQQEKTLYAQGRFSPFLLAETCALLGDKKEALQYLQAAYDQHADGVAQIEGDPFFNNLHQEPAYRELATRIGLPPPPP